MWNAIFMLSIYWISGYWIWCHYCLFFGSVYLFWVYLACIEKIDDIIPQQHTLNFMITLKLKGLKSTYIQYRYLWNTYLYIVVFQTISRSDMCLLPTTHPLLVCFHYHRHKRAVFHENKFLVQGQNIHHSAWEQDKAELHFVLKYNNRKYTLNIYLTNYSVSK